MISKNQINKRIKRKTNPELVETIELAKKNKHLELAKKLSGPTRLQSKINLEQLDKLDSKKIIVVGSVLGQGEISKRIEIAALRFSEQAKEKLKNAKIEIKTIKQELKSNKKLEGVRVI